MENELKIGEVHTNPLIVLAVTSHVSMDFFKGQINSIRSAGFDVAVICSPGWDNLDGVKYFPVPMEREIAILRDIRSLYMLIKIMYSIRPAIVNAGTPKAGLLVGIAAFMSNVPIRIYTCHGLRLETLTGWKRKLLTLTEQIAGLCAHKVVCVSKSLRNKVIQLKLVPESKVTALGAGSCNGIDLNRFTKIQTERPAIERILPGWGITADAIFIGFIGRLTKDKGIVELVEAFDRLKSKFSNLYLLLLGGFEEGDPLSEEIRQRISQENRIIDLGLVPDTVPYYKLMRVLVLPTYREGLPTVLLEAAAMEIPVVASRATGCVDVVIEGKTGLLVPVGDSEQLANAISRILANNREAAAMGRKARQRIETHFKQELVWKNTVEFYNKLLVANKLEVVKSPGKSPIAKRVMDLLLSLILLVLLLPVFILVAILIWSKIGPPIFFKQKRPGLHAKPFDILKFRTMTDEKDKQGRLLPDEKRLPRIGAMIRKLSLDELPQLFNVVKGELSLVGPRPLMMQYLPRYTPEQARRHDVKPGITGWAQINGRNSISWEEKFKLDIWYVENQSIWLDIKILCLTVLKVVRQEGISQDGYVTMSEFTGSAEKIKL